MGRIDVLEAPAETVLTFYGPPCLHVEPLPLLGEEDLVELDHHAEDDGVFLGGWVLGLGELDVVVVPMFLWRVLATTRWLAQPQHNTHTHTHTHAITHTHTLYTQQPTQQHRGIGRVVWTAKRPCPGWPACS